MDDEFDDPTLSDPDGDNGNKAAYGWDDEFQRHVIALIVSDRQFMLQSLDMVKPTYFANKVHQKACEIAKRHFEEYRVLPNKMIMTTEIKAEFKDNKSLPAYLAELNILYDYFKPGLENREYLRDKITYFAKIQSVKEAFKECLDLMDKNPESEATWDKIYDKMRDSMTTHANFEIGINYFKSIRDRYAVAPGEDGGKVFKVGMPTVDNEVSFTSGEMISVVAGSGVGKSVWLANLVGTNLALGHKGLYISLEMSETKIASRLDAILSGFPIKFLHANKEDLFKKLESLDGVDYESEHTLVIKQFPAATATVNTIRAYISQLKFHGFTPDFVVIDYVGEMKLDNNIPSHEARENNVRDLRGLATEEDIFMATAMQPNRDAKKDAKSGEKNLIDDEHLAGSFGQIRPLDFCFSLNQNDNEKELGIGRGLIIKLRDGESRKKFYLKWEKKCLRIIETNQTDYIKALNNHKERAADAVKMNLLHETTNEDAWKENMQAPIEEDSTANDDVLNEKFEEDLPPEAMGF